MDGSRGHQLWDVQHQIGCLVLWDPPDRNSHLRKNTIPRYGLFEITSYSQKTAQILLCYLMKKKKLQSICQSACFFSLFIRYDEPRGDQESRQVIQDAMSRRLSRGTVWYHDGVLEAEAWRPTDFWISSEHSQRLFYCHGRTIWDAAVMTEKENVFRCGQWNLLKNHDLNG